jgi:uncharacterized protein
MLSRTMIAALGLSSALASALDAQATATAPAPPQVVVSGTGEARIVTDRATLMLGVQTRAATASLAATDNARRLRAILDTLRAIGLASEQLSTMNYNVAPEMQYPAGGNQPPKVTGYVVTNTVRADLHRIDDVGRTIDAALAKGANEISSLQLFSSKADSARRVALAAAVADARAQAEVLARASGGALGSLIEISSTQETIRPVLARATAAMAAVRTPIEPGEQTISATVTARWTFVPGR